MLKSQFGGITCLIQICEGLRKRSGKRKTGRTGTYLAPKPSNYVEPEDRAEVIKNNGGVEELDSNTKALIELNNTLKTMSNNGNDIKWKKLRMDTITEEDNGNEERLLESLQQCPPKPRWQRSLNVNMV